MIFALLFILSVLIEKEAVGGEAAVFCTYIICVAGGLVGGILASDSKFENSMICAAVFAGVKVLLTALNEASKNRECRKRNNISDPCNSSHMRRTDRHKKKDKKEKIKTIQIGMTAGRNGLGRSK